MCGGRRGRMSVCVCIASWGGCVFVCVCVRACVSVGGVQLVWCCPIDASAVCCRVC